MKLNINRKEIPIGNVGYYVDVGRYDEETESGFYAEKIKRKVFFGIIEEHYAKEICLQLIEPKDTRLFNGVPIVNLPKVGEWIPLPKGQKRVGVDTIVITKSEVLDLNINIKDPQAILDAYHSGILVNIQDQEYFANVRAEDWHDYTFHGEGRILGKTAPKYTYRMLKEFSWYMYHPYYKVLPFFDVYATYDEAKKVADAINAESERKANLSPYDYSVEEIDKTLDLYCGYKCYDSDLKATIRKKLLSLDNIEDLYVRICGGELQYRYEKQKKWKKVSSLFGE